MWVILNTEDMFNITVLKDEDGNTRLFHEEDEAYDFAERELIEYHITNLED